MVQVVGHWVLTSVLLPHQNKQKTIKHLFLCPTLWFACFLPLSASLVSSHVSFFLPGPTNLLLVLQVLKAFPQTSFFNSSQIPTHPWAQLQCHFLRKAAPEFPEQSVPPPSPHSIPSQYEMRNLSNFHICLPYLLCSFHEGKIHPCNKYLWGLWMLLCVRAFV